MREPLHVALAICAGSVLLVILIIALTAFISSFDFLTFWAEHPILTMIGYDFFFWLLGLIALAITVYVVVRVARHAWKGGPNG